MDTMGAEYAVVSGAARGQWQVRNELVHLHRHGELAPTDPGILGDTAAARALTAALAHADDATTRAVWALSRRCEHIAVGARDVRHIFRSTDAHVAEVFTTMLGGLR